MRSARNLMFHHFTVDVEEYFQVLALEQHSPRSDWDVLPSRLRFVLAPLLMILVILKLKLIPSTVGWSGIFSVKAILPVATLAAGSMLGVIRYTRASVIEVLGQDYVAPRGPRGCRCAWSSAVTS